MKKFRMSAFIMMLVVALVLTACSGGSGSGSSQSSSSSSSSSGGSGSGGSSAPQSSGEQQKEKVSITLSAGIETPEEGIYYETVKYLQDVLPQRTDNQIKVDIYPNQQLGNEVSMLEGVRSGSVDITVTGIGNFSSFVPKFQVFSVPYIFKNYDVYRAAMKPDSEVWGIMKRIVEEADLGFTLGAPTTVGSRWVVNTKGEVRTPDDLAKLNVKMRVQASPIETEVWSGYGAHTVNMPMPEVYAAMKQGVVDAVENAPSILYTNKIHEVANYFSATDHSYYVALVSISNAALEKMPEDLRQIVLEVLEEAGQHALDLSLEMHQDYVNKIKETGVTVTEVDKDAFASMVEPIQARVAEETGGMEIFEAIKRLE